MPKTLSNVHQRVFKISRLARYFLYIFIIVVIWQFASTYGFVSLQSGDDSVDDVSGMRRIVIKRASSEEQPYEIGSVIIFAMLNSEDEQVFRISRVAAGPGDVVESESGKYTINGEMTKFALSENQDLTGKTPTGFYLVLNDNPFSTYPDSRRIGLIDHKWIVGRFLSETPF